MTIQQMQTQAGLQIPADFEVLHIEESYVHCRRGDGLEVFLDRGTDEVSLKLNQIRIHGSKEQVVKGVGMIRGMQIALNFARKYCSELVPQLRDDIERALSQIKVLPEP